MMLNPRQFHGGGWVASGRVEPSAHPATGRVAAWSSSDIDVAADYAGAKARRSGALFAPIYEVEPDSVDYTHNNTVGSTSGMRVLRTAGYADMEGKLL